MLEFFAIFSLCKLNRKLALEKGRRPGGFIALTIILWIVFELIGVIIAYANGADKYGAMIVGLLVAGIGGLISFLITKSIPRGNYVDPNAVSAGPYYGANGMPVYTNPNAAQVPVQAPAYMYDPNMMSQQAPQPVQPFAGQPVQPFAPAQPVQPAGQTAGIRYCPACGGANKPGNKFCESCGQNIE